MAKVTILGAGVMATAMTIPLADNGHEVHLVGTHLDDDIIDEVRAHQTHPRLRAPVPDTIRAIHLDHLESCGGDRFAPFGCQFTGHTMGG